MAEIKRTFLKSKMNKDLDERLVPNGEYRDALNVEVSTSEGSNVGSVQNLKGNTNVTVTDHNNGSIIDGSKALSDNATTVGTYSDESTKAIYNFIHLASDLVADGSYAGATRYTGIKSDCITEFKPFSNQDGGTTRPVVTDVFEVRSEAAAAEGVSDVIEGLATEANNPFAQDSSHIPAGIRVGMRVQKISLSGQDLWGNNHKLYVKKILNSQENNGKIQLTSIVPFAMTQADIDSGVVYKFTSERVLEFDAGILKTEENTTGTPSTKTPIGKTITAINLIDDILYYTDGRTEPKRISLDKFRNKFNFIYRHSNHRWKNSQGVQYTTALKRELITVIRKNPTTAPVVETLINNRSVEQIVINGVPQDAEYSTSTISSVSVLSINPPVEFGNFAFNNNIDEVFTPSLEATGQPQTLTIQTSSFVNWRVGDIIELTGQITASEVTVQIVTADAAGGYYNVFEVALVSVSESYTGNSPAEPWVGSLKNKKKVYEDNFVCFAYRYKYVDEEYSAISPYSNIAFVPSFYSYNPNKGFNGGMVNKTQEIKVLDFIPPNIPEDVRSVELLFKKTNSTNVHAIESFEKGIGSWNITGTSPNYKGRVSISSEVFGKALESSQLTRVFDNVPVKAFAQEFSSNRLMYGNYFENYDLKNGLANSFTASITQGVRVLDTTFTQIIGSSNEFSANQIAEPVMATTNFYEGGNVPNANAPSEETWDATWWAGMVDEWNMSEEASALNAQVYFGLPTRGEDDPFNNFNDQLPRGWFFDSESPKGPYFQAPTAGYYTFSASAEVAPILKPFLGTSPNGQQNNIVGDYEPAAPIIFGLAKVDDSGVWKDWFGDDNISNYHNFPGGVPTIGTPGTVNHDNPNLLHVGGTSSASIGSSTRVSQFGTKSFSNVTVYLEEGEKVAAGFIPPISTDPSNNQPVVEWQGTLRLRNCMFRCDNAPDTTQTITTETAQPSVKSGRSYEIGVVYSDRYGRESTVVLDEASGVEIAKSYSDKVNRLYVRINSQAPEWATHYRFYLKEIASEYHNMVLYKAYTTGIDGNDEGPQNFSHVWLAFNSADRNKVSKQSYLIQKKQHGNAVAVSSEAAKYRVLDIVDNATVDPDDPNDEGTEQEISIGSLDLDALGADFDDINGKFFVKIEADNDFTVNINNNGTNDSFITDDQNTNNGAVFEVVSEQLVDLELFYEISQAFPIKLDAAGAQELIKEGDRVVPYSGYTDNQVNNFNNLSATNGGAFVENVQGATSFGSSQLSYHDSGVVLVKLNLDGLFLPPNGYLQFIRPNGSYYTLKVGQTSLGDTVKIYPYTHRTSENLHCTSEHLLSFFNCFSFGNGVESDRIRDDFNADVMYPYTTAGKQSGFKASLNDKNYKRIHRPNNIIFSQIKNEQSILNRTNEFLMAENIVKKLSPEYGSIQKLYTRNTDLIAFCESKVLKILANKDALFNADGNPQLLSSTNVLGQAVPFVGDYGISKNPESFAVDEFRSYFVDKDRGSVLRLSRDGISPISDFGMKDWFRDNLKDSVLCLGSYDGRKDEYNITIHTYNASTPGNKNVYTLSYSESAKGWISFKSWIQESGVSLSNDYYTFKNSKMYVHHKNNTYNNFYGTQFNSTISPLFNDFSGSVKHFDTVSYEGTQSRVVKFTDEVVDGVTYNDDEYYNQVAKNGWYIESISTDLQEGHVDEFIEKENKWFNYIKGITTSHTNLADGAVVSNLDFSEINMQGIGELSANATSDTGGFGEGYDVLIDVNGSSSAQWSSTGYQVYNQSSYASTGTFTIVPNVGYAVAAANFSVSNALPAYITSVTFSDSGVPGTADNIVTGTITFEGTLSADVSHTLQIDTAAGLTMIQWIGTINVFGVTADMNVSLNPSDELEIAQIFPGQNIAGGTSYLMYAYIPSQANTFEDLFTVSVDAGSAHFFDTSASSSVSIDPVYEADNYAINDPTFVNFTDTIATALSIKIGYASQDANIVIDNDNNINIYLQPIPIICEFDSYMPDAAYSNLPTAPFDDDGGFSQVGITTNVGIPSVKVVATTDGSDWLTPQDANGYIINQPYGGALITGYVSEDQASFVLAQNTGSTRNLRLHLFSALNNTDIADDILVIKQTVAEELFAGIRYAITEETSTTVDLPGGGQTTEYVPATYSPLFENLTDGNLPNGPSIFFQPPTLKLSVSCNNQPDGPSFSTGDVVITYTNPDDPFIFGSGGNFISNGAAYPINILNQQTFLELVLSLSENTGDVERTAVITVRHPLDNTVTDTVTITQKAAYNQNTNTFVFLDNIGGQEPNPTVTPNFFQLNQFYYNTDPHQTVTIHKGAQLKTLYIKIPDEDYQFIFEQLMYDDAATEILPVVYTSEGGFEASGLTPQGTELASIGDPAYVFNEEVSTFSPIEWGAFGPVQFYGVGLAYYKFTFSVTENGHVIPGNIVPDARYFSIKGFHPFNTTGVPDSEIRIKQLPDRYTQYNSNEPITLSGDIGSDGNGNHVFYLPCASNNGAPNSGWIHSTTNIFSDQDYQDGAVPDGLVTYSTIDNAQPTWLISTEIVENPVTTTNQDFSVKVVIAPNATEFTRRVWIKIANSEAFFGTDFLEDDDPTFDIRKIIIPSSAGQAFLWVGSASNLSTSSTPFATGLNGALDAYSQQSESINTLSFESAGAQTFSSRINFNGPLPFISNARFKEEGDSSFTDLTDASQASWIVTVPSVVPVEEDGSVYNLVVRLKEGTGNEGDAGAELKFDLVSGFDNSIVKSYTIFRV